MGDNCPVEMLHCPLEMLQSDWIAIFSQPEQNLVWACNLTFRLPFCTWSSGHAQLSWIITNISHQLQALGDIIRSDFLPTLTGHSPPNNTIRKLMALPARLGGLGIADPSLTSNCDYNDSIKATAALCKLIREKNHVYSYEALAD